VKGVFLSQYLTVAQLAELLPYSAWSIREFVKKGILPCHRATPRSKIMFDPEQVKQALRQYGTPTA
jgi:hypothetical protein